jgi:hypothetical protein
MNVKPVAPTTIDAIDQPGCAGAGLPGLGDE